MGRQAHAPSRRRRELGDEAAPHERSECAHGPSGRYHGRPCRPDGCQRWRSRRLLLGLPAVHASAQSRPLTLQPRDRIVLLGNTLAERMQLFNHFETLLATRFPDLLLTVRNLGWSGDTVTLQPRPAQLRDHAHTSLPTEGRRDPRLLRSQRVIRRRGRSGSSSSRIWPPTCARTWPPSTTARAPRAWSWCRPSRTSGWRG